jgi:transcriptional regulator with XRE-family HTH domain
MSPDELRAGRRALGMTAAGLARMLGVSDRTIRAWEHGAFKGRPYPAPEPVALLMRILLRSAEARAELGISLKHETQPLPRGPADGGGVGRQARKR